VRKEGLAAQDCGARADTGMIIAKDIVRGVKKDALFFVGELLINADPFHCSTSVGQDCSVTVINNKLTSKNIERC